MDAIPIDEAQFLFSPEEVDTLPDIVGFYEIPVLCYGLRADFRTRLFPGSMRLMEIADVIEEVPTVCWCGTRTVQYEICKRKIVRKERLPDFSLDRMRVMALCRKHYKEAESCGWKMSEIRIQEVQEERS